MTAGSATTPLVDVRNLSVDFSSNGALFHAVKSVSFSIGKGETVALVGEFRLGQVRFGVVDHAAAGLPRSIASLR